MTRFWVFACLVCVAWAWAPTQCGPGNLITQWGKLVNPSSVLPEYPRPQQVRNAGTSGWVNLNGLWQFQPASKGESPPFNQTLKQEILVPFPVESCLSGIGENYQYLWYRQLFNKTFTSGKTLLHFEAIDWQATVYLNGKSLGTHTGGFDGFSFDITSDLVATNNEIIVYVYDPSETGFQPNGKQFISAIKNPGGDVYTPSSGIWQTVWLENVPDTYITGLKITTDAKSVKVTVSASSATSVNISVTYKGAASATGSGQTGSVITISPSNPQLWEPDHPNLYDMKITLGSGGDSVASYFGLRTFGLVDSYFPGQPDTGPQVGIDRSGGDMPNQPITIASDDYNLCYHTCQNTSGCKAWAYAVVNCDGYTKPTCWLKSSIPGESSNKCRVSGALATGSGTVKAPLLNGHGGAEAVSQTGYNRPGEDLAGYPVNIASSQACNDLCTNDKDCYAWVYGVPSCGGNPAQAQCWLKNNFPNAVANQCFNSGAKAKPLFLAGWLDQSFWPDGLFTAPTDEALAFDIKAIKTFGMNIIRLHQKVNSERWYYYADTVGVIVFQDMPQKYGGATSATVDPFMADLTAMVTGPRANHPSIVQWETFNEGDCYGVFNVPDVVDYVKSLDPVRPVDTDSGGGANDLHVGDVNDVHSYPYPANPLPLSNQYAMLGEFGGIGAFVSGHEWVPGQCQTYLAVSTPEDEANTYISMTETIQTHRLDISASIYTQITDVERECDGFYNYDRTNKFSTSQTQAVYNANDALIHH